MKKKAGMALLMTGLMMTAMPAQVFAQEEGTSAAVGETGEKPGEDIYDFEIEMEGSLYRLPMTFEEFTAEGWELSDPEAAEETLGTSTYNMVYFTKGEMEICAFILNLGINEIPVTEGLVAGLEVDAQYQEYDLEALNICLAKGIKVGTSTLEDLKAAYGEPSDVYEGELSTKYTYQRDYNQRVEFNVPKEEGCLMSVDIRNFIEPEGFDKGSVSTEMPQIVTDYQAPEALGTELLEPVVEFCGDLYRLPCPVTALQANGWELLDVEEGAFVPGDSLEFVEMMRENKTVRFSIYNLTENAVVPENCFVTELKAASYDEGVTLRVSGDLTVGAQKADVIAMAEEKGLAYDDSEGYLTIYADKDHKLDTSLECWINESESATAIASLTYHNEVLEQ